MSMANNPKSVEGMDVPESCIESAETILRTINNPGYQFTKGGQGSSKDRPAMYLRLRKGGHVSTINVSDNTSSQTFTAASGATSYFAEDTALADIPYGKGVCFMNVSHIDHGTYNMHFLARIKESRTRSVTLSDVSEPGKWDGKTLVTLAGENLVSATTVAELRKSLGGDYQDHADHFACGEISLTAP